MLITNELEQKILYDPALITGLGCNSLKIITGFTDCDRIRTHMITLRDGMERTNKLYNRGIDVSVILGMTKGANLTKSKHSKIQSTLRRINVGSQTSFHCNYIYTGQEVHSKVYVWCKDDVPKIAFCGSANYSINAFQKRREAMCDCSPLEAVAYYEELLGNSIGCFHPQLGDFIKFSEIQPKVADADIDADNLENLSYAEYDAKEPVDTIKVSLLTTKGEVGFGSGLNWGIRRNGAKRDRNQAYIPYNAADKKEGFFPDRVNPEDKNCPLFKVITKDDVFYMRMAQAGEKGLHTAESNAIIGKWIRDKLGVPSGTFIKLEMLEDFGSTHVVFRKYENNVYVLDYEPER